MMLTLLVWLFSQGSLLGELISVADFDGSPVPFAPGEDWVIGWEFTPTLSLEVVRLGYYDELGNGLAEAHDVGLWQINSSGPSHTLIASTTVSAGTDATLDGRYRFQNIASVFLTPG